MDNKQVSLDDSKVILENKNKNIALESDKETIFSDKEVDLDTTKETINKPTEISSLETVREDIEEKKITELASPKLTKLESKNVELETGTKTITNSNTVNSLPNTTFEIQENPISELPNDSKKISDNKEINLESKKTLLNSDQNIESLPDTKDTINPENEVTLNDSKTELNANSSVNELSKEKTTLTTNKSEVSLSDIKEKIQETNKQVSLSTEKSTIVKPKEVDLSSEKETLQESEKIQSLENKIEELVDKKDTQLDKTKVNLTTKTTVKSLEDSKETLKVSQKTTSLPKDKVTLKPKNKVNSLNTNSSDLPDSTNEEISELENHKETIEDSNQVSLEDWLDNLPGEDLDISELYTDNVKLNDTTLIDSLESLISSENTLEKQEVFLSDHKEDIIASEDNHLDDHKELAPNDTRERVSYKNEITDSKVSRRDEEDHINSREDLVISGPEDNRERVGYESNIIDSKTTRRDEEKFIQNRPNILRPNDTREEVNYDSSITDSKTTKRSEEDYLNSRENLVVSGPNDTREKVGYDNKITDSKTTRRDESNYLESRENLVENKPDDSRETVGYENKITDSKTTRRSEEDYLNYSENSVISKPNDSRETVGYDNKITDSKTTRRSEEDYLESRESLRQKIQGDHREEVDYDTLITNSKSSRRNEEDYINSSETFREKILEDSRNEVDYFSEISSSKDTRKKTPSLKYSDSGYVISRLGIMESRPEDTRREVDYFTSIDNSKDTKKGTPETNEDGQYSKGIIETRPNDTRREVDYFTSIDNSKETRKNTPETNEDGQYSKGIMESRPNDTREEVDYFSTILDPKHKRKTTTPKTNDEGYVISRPGIMEARPNDTREEVSYNTTILDPKKFKRGAEDLIKNRDKILEESKSGDNNVSKLTPPSKLSDFTLTANTIWSSDKFNPNAYLRAGIDPLLREIPVHGVLKSKLIDETLHSLVTIRTELEKGLKINRDRLPGTSTDNLWKSSLKELAGGTTGKDLAKTILGSANKKLGNGLDRRSPINRPEFKNGKVIQKEWNSYYNNVVDTGKTEAANTRTIQNLLSGDRVSENGLFDFGMIPTLEDLFSAKDSSSIEDIDGLKTCLKNSRYFTTPDKFTSTNSSTNYTTLDSNHIWEIIFRPYIGMYNGYRTWLPSFAELDYKNKKAFNVTTRYSSGWLPITGFELQEKKLTSKELPLFDGSITYPVGLEFTNELRLTFADDSIKSLRRYFDLCTKVSAYMSNVHTVGSDFRVKDNFDNLKISDPTVFLEGKVHPGLYKNLSFWITIYILSPQLATIKKSDLLCVIKDHTIENQGEIDSSPTELTMTFSIVGENPGEEDYLISGKVDSYDDSYTPPPKLDKDTDRYSSNSILNNLDSLVEVF